MDTLPVSPAPGQPSLFTTGVARLRSGDRVAIMGRNGGGKSSLLRLLWQQMNKASLLSRGCACIPGCTPATMTRRWRSCWTRPACSRP